MIIGVITIIAIALYIWIAYFEIPSKVEKGEDGLQEESWKVEIIMKGEVN